MGTRRIHDELSKQTYWRPDQLAFAFEDIEYTYGAFGRRVNATANRFLAQGIETGDHVLVHGHDHVDWHTIFYACSMVGARFCPVSTYQSLENLSYITSTVDPDIVVYSGDDDIVVDRLPTIRNVSADATYLCLDSGASPPGDDRTFDSFVNGSDTEPPARSADIEPDTIHNVFWTSGTTGRPKAVLRDHRSSLHFADNLVNDLPFRSWNVRATTNPMMLIDAYFHYGIPTLMVGGTNVIRRQFSPNGLYDDIEQYGINSLHLGFTLARRMVEFLEERDETLDLRYLSAVMPSANIAASLWPHTDRLYHLYGTTEIGLPLVQEHEPPFEGRPSLGKPGVSTDVRLVDPDRDGIPTSPPSPGDIGELACRGETTMTRYGDPEMHDAAVSDGWIRPGDVFRVDETRNLEFVGRTDDRIRSGGVNVYPGDIEAVLEDHPDVDNAVVVGVDDDAWGQRVCALVVSSVSDPETLRAELETHCLRSDRVADELRPREYAVVHSNEDIPAGGLGKPDTDAIATQFFG